MSAGRSGTGLTSRALWVFPLAIAGFAVVLLPNLWLDDTPMYQAWLTPRRVLVAHSLAKLAFLVAAAWAAGLAARAFGTGNPARRGWTLMAAGFGASSVGQAILDWYHVVLKAPSPYPSAADPPFVLGMLSLACALVDLMLVYTGADLPLATRRQVASTAAVFALPILALVAWLLRPVLAHPAPLLEQVLNIVYPLLDCALLACTMVLARITARLRGGRVHRMWEVLLAGFLCTAAGDVLFSYLSTLGIKRLDPLVHLMYVASYALWAWGAALQRRIGVASG